MFTIEPINSIYDVRLVKLAQAFAELAQELALTKDKDPELIIVEALLQGTTRLISATEDDLMDKLLDNYPCLQTILD